MESGFSFSAHYLIMIYVCTKFRKNILNGLVSELWSGHNFNNITEAHNSVKIVSGVTVLVLRILSIDK